MIPRLPRTFAPSLLRPTALPVLAMVACSPDPIEFTISPNPVAFGETDFAVELPEEGYNPIATTLTNNGLHDVTLTLADWDDDYLCVQGYAHDARPGAMATVAPGSTYVLNIAVCGYLAGERDTEIRTEISISTDSTPSSFAIPVTFTPIQTFEDTAN
ncbi:MAG: hypothetical protein EXR69_04680 [Myxococcales bacterium]|nr:hypothetical protein [Myxococcales bacterium]